MRKIQKKVVHIGDVPVGDDHPTVVMAEIGTFYNQDIVLARDYLAQAIEAGAPIVKTEIVHDADACLPGTGLEHAYVHASGTTVEDYRALFERKVVPLADYEKLFAFCRDMSVPFVASVYDLAGIDFLVKTGGAAVKIARNNIDNVPLIRHAARSGLPVFFDAGGVYFREIAAAVELARAEGATDIIINHHPGANPAPAEIHNLRMIETYKRTFDVPVGLACHFRGNEILYAATALGANILEKGVDADPDREEQDLISAASLAELSDIVRQVRNCWLSIGSEQAMPSEPRDLSTRAGLFARQDIAEGELFTSDNVAFAFPPLGISVADYDAVIGAKSLAPLKEGDVLHWQDVGRES
jgi:sialic acid synthase SpsE